MSTMHATFSEIEKCRRAARRCLVSLSTASLLLLGSLNASANDNLSTIAYKLAFQPTPVDKGKPRRLQVTLEFVAESDITEIRFPRWPAHQRAKDSVVFSNIETDGQSLDLPADDFVVKVPTQPGSTTSVSYHIRLLDHGAPIYLRDKKLPSASDKSIRIPLAKTLARPAFVRCDRRQPCRRFNFLLDWQGPDGWHIGAPGRLEGQSVSLQAQNARAASAREFVAAQSMLAKVVVDGKQIPVFGTQRAGFTAALLDKNATRLLGPVNRVFGGEAPEFYFWLDEVRRHDKPTQPIVSGFHVTTSIALFGTDFEGNLTSVILALIHEQVHHWVHAYLFDYGGKHRRSDYLWFFEGFTEFVAEQVLLDTGLLNYTKLVIRYNERLEKYYNLEAAAAALSDSTGQREDMLLPKVETEMLRGYLLARELAAEASASGDRALIDRIKEIASPATSADNSLSMRELLTVLSSDSPSRRSRIAAFVESTRQLDIRPDTLGPCARLTWKTRKDKQRLPLFVVRSESDAASCSPPT